jgi:hypothetical protein
LRERKNVAQDQEHLRLLGIFHYIAAGLACFLPFASLVYIGMGVAMVNGKFPAAPHAAGTPNLGGWFFIAIGVFIFFFGLLGAVLNFLAARAIIRRERHTLVLVVAGLNCMHMPLGTLLGVFTFVVLARPSVKALFTRAPAELPEGPTWPGPGAGYPPGTSPFSNPKP